MSAESKEQAASEADDSRSSSATGAASASSPRNSWKVALDATDDGAFKFVFKTKGGLLAAITAVLVAFVALDLLITGGETIRALLS